MPDNRGNLSPGGSLWRSSTTSLGTRDCRSSCCLELGIRAAGTLFAATVLALAVIHLSICSLWRITSPLTAGALLSMPSDFGVNHTNGTTRKESP